MISIQNVIIQEVGKSLTSKAYYPEKVLRKAAKLCVNVAVFLEWRNGLKFSDVIGLTNVIGLLYSIKFEDNVLKGKIVGEFPAKVTRVFWDCLARVKDIDGMMIAEDIIEVSGVYLRGVEKSEIQ